MLVIKKIFLLGAALFSALIVILLGAYGYFALMGLGAGRQMQLKFVAERFVFLTVLFVLGLAVFYLFLYLHSRRTFKQLEKITDVVHYGEEEITEYLKKLGPLGHQIGTLFHELNRINNSKTAKISSLANFNKFLIDNIDLKLLAIDAAGKVTHCSKKMITEVEKDKNSLVGKEVDQILPGLKIHELLLELKTSRKPVMHEEMDTLFYPIFDVDNRLSAIICILEGKEIAPEVAKTSEQIKAPESGPAKRFLGFLRKKNV